MSIESRSRPEAALDSTPRADTTERDRSTTLPVEAEQVVAEVISRVASLRAARAHKLRLFAVTLMAAAVSLPSGLAAADSADFAVRGQGYLGYSNLFEGLDAFQGGGAGSASLVFDGLYVQADLSGDAMEFEGDAEVNAVSPGLHLGWRNTDLGSAGVAATYNHLDLGAGSLDAYRVGFEGEVYLDKLTLGLDAGYFDLDGSGQAYVDGHVSIYPDERARVDLRGGVVGVDQGNPLVQFGAAGELLVSDHLAPFLRWEGSFPDDFGTSFQHSAVAGLTVYWGGDSPSIQAYDRTYFQSSCNSILLIARIC